MFLEFRTELGRNESRFDVLLQANCVDLGAMWILMAVLSAGCRETPK